MEVLATAVREEKVIKCIQIRKVDVKLSLFEDDMILYIENPKTESKILSYLVNLEKFHDTKSIDQNHLHFYILTIKNQKEQLRNQCHFTMAPK